jgi:hypothetical protein
MPDNNKHKLFSKEELFRLIDEKRSLPEDADDFDKEALEGLSMVKDRERLSELDHSIDEVLHLEKAKSRKRRNIYMLSAAASLLLLIGLFFFLKDNMTEKDSSHLAQNKELPNAQEPGEQKITAEELQKPVETTADNGEVTTAVSSSKQSGGEDPKTADAISVPAGPAEKHNQDMEPKLAESTKEARPDDDYKKRKLDEAAGDESKTANLEQKTRVEPNTTWTTPAGTAANSGAGNGNTNLPVAEKNVQRVLSTQAGVYSKSAKDVPADERSGLVRSENESSKKSKAKKQEAQPSRELSGQADGYTYYDQKAGGKQNAQQEAEQMSAPSYNAAPVAGNIVSDQLGMDKTTTVEKGKEEDKAYRSQSQNNMHDNQALAEVKTESRTTQNEKTNSNVRKAEFPEGETALKKYVDRNLTISSPDVTGDIIVEFTVGSDGVIDSSDIRIVSPLKNCKPCSNDVTNLVKKMPKWNPAKDNGIPIETRQKLKVHYDGRAKK